MRCRRCCAKRSPRPAKRCFTSRCGPIFPRRSCSAALRRRAASNRSSTFLRKAVNLSPPAIGLLHEAAASAGHRLASLDATALTALIGAVPVRLTGSGVAGARHLHRRRRFVRGTRRAFHAASPARHVCRGRNAGLGGADRRLSAPGLVCDRRRRRARGAALACRTCGSVLCEGRVLKCRENRQIEPPKSNRPCPRN